MSVEIAWKQNILVTDFHLLKSLLVVLGFGSQAFVCGFSRQNINSVEKHSLHLLFPQCNHRVVTQRSLERFYALTVFFFKNSYLIFKTKTYGFHTFKLCNLVQIRTLQNLKTNLPMKTSKKHTKRVLKKKSISSPDCPKDPIIENSYWKCGSRYLCLLLCVYNSSSAEKVGKVSKLNWK